MLDQTVSQDSKLGQLWLDIWSTNTQGDKAIPEHRLLSLHGRRSRSSLQEVLYPPHPSQSNN